MKNLTLFNLYLFGDESLYDDEIEASKLESDGSWTRSTILKIRANNIITNTINKEYKAHNWHLVFPVFGVSKGVWLVLVLSDDNVPEFGSELIGCKGGNVANVSSLLGSGCDRWDTTTAEWGRLFDLLALFDFLWRSAVWEFVDKPEEAEDEDTQLFADDTASYNEWSNVLL